MEKLQDPIIKKEVNTPSTSVIANEDRNKVRSDKGSKMAQIEYKKTTAKPKQKKPTKRARLLENRDIKRWYDNLARSSIITAEVRLRKLGRFCENNKITPMELIELGLKRPKAVADLLEDTITTMEKKQNAPQYIKATITTVKSWLHHFDIEVKRRIRITNPDATPTLTEERVPEAAELEELFDRASLRTATIMSLMCKAGLRPEVLGNFTGTDGLVLKDLPDLEMDGKTARFAKVPAKVIVRSTISKARHSYFTFITEGGAKKILAYLNQRIAEGETLIPESSLIAPLAEYLKVHKKSQGKKFLSTARIETTVREEMRPRFKWRPYVLRAFFDTQLLIAESRGKIAHDFRVFFMGHKGSIEAKYTTNKSILTMELADEMFEAFRRSQEHLDLERSIQQEKEETRQQVVMSEEAEQLLAKGWKYLGTLPNGKVVIEK